jgi:catechol 2,3-dioxygenase-like lactoylglutathione lyase family enzyme
VTTESNHLIELIDHVAIIVADLESASRFVSDVLGLEPAGSFDDPSRSIKVAFFTEGSAKIELIELTDDSQRRERLGDRRARIDHLALRVSDLDASFARLSAAGVGFRDAHGPVSSSPPLADSSMTTRASTLKQSRILFTDPDSTLDVIFQLVELTGG